MPIAALTPGNGLVVRNNFTFMVYDESANVPVEVIQRVSADSLVTTLYDPPLNVPVVGMG
jgi:hypothetical protein